MSTHGQGGAGTAKDWRNHAGRAPDDRNNNNGPRSPGPGAIGQMLNEAVNKYASTKTTAQLFLDLGVTVGHIFSAVALWQLTRRDSLWVVITTLLIVTVVLQIVLAIGLISLRLMGNEGEAIPSRAKLLNNIFFWMCGLVALLEISISGIEHFGLDGMVDLVNGTKVCPK